MIHKLLIANRGEIARRIIRTCREMGILTAVVHSEADRHGIFVAEADEAINIGGHTPAESYLRQDLILAAAKRVGADAIHPGFGFLSENADFARQVTEAGLIFVGPSAESIAAMGSKAQSKIILRQNPEVPLIPGYEGEDQTLERLSAEALHIGFPVLLKASAGGGGKGMRIVRRAEELEPALLAAKNEGLAAFGNDRLIIEKYFDRARHIEVQILGDKFGKLLHFYERECSLQRRFQKVVEEAPSPTLTPAQREQLCAAALAVGRSVDYYNAGTVEMIFDEASQAFYFLEMNTRLQVEHPVTEQVTGVDLVRLQLEVAAGLALSLNQEDIQLNGSAIEVRLYAEDAANDFRPAIGTIELWKTAETANIRYESGVDTGSVIDVFYDPMIAKIIATASTRREATTRLVHSLSKLAALGLTTNRAFLIALLRHKAFVENTVDTRWIERHLPELQSALVPNADALNHYAIAALLYRWSHRQAQRQTLKNLPAAWRNLPFQLPSEGFKYNEQELVLSYKALSGQGFEIKINEATYTVELLSATKQDITLVIDGLRTNFTVATQGDNFFIQNDSQAEVKLQAISRFPEMEIAKVPGSYDAPMPGQVVRVPVAVGDKVEEGTPLIVLSSMKMENTIYAYEAGTVVEIYAEAGQFVQADSPLLKINTEG